MVTRVGKDNGANSAWTNQQWRRQGYNCECQSIVIAQFEGVYLTIKHTQSKPNDERISNKTERLETAEFVEKLAIEKTIDRNHIVNLLLKKDKEIIEL